MPEWSYNARQVMHAETLLWNASHIVQDAVCEIQSESWRKKAKSITDAINEFAAELREYNEQFETEDD